MAEISIVNIARIVIGVIVKAIRFNIAYCVADTFNEKYYICMILLMRSITYA